MDHIIIASQEGVQQGDPLGPLLFSLAIQGLASSLSSDFNAWYLDDGTLGGDPGVVLDDFRKIIAAKDELGLEINDRKCELLILGPQEDVAPGILEVY